MILWSGKRKQEVVPRPSVCSTSNKRTRTRVRKALRLLELPAELRILILEFLLVQPQVLRNMILDPRNRLIYDCNYDSMIQVATTCRQLAQEALPIIYEKNTFEILIFTPPNSINTRMIMLGEELSVNSPPEVLSRVRRICVNIHGWPREMDEDDTWTDRRAVHELCELLRAYVDLTHLELEVNMDYRWALTEDNDIREIEVLRPLAFLRGIKLVTINGIDIEHASAWRKVMMSPGYIERIWQMKTAFQDWCSFQQGDTFTDLDEQATSAIYACDIVGFKRYRSEVVLRLQAEMNRDVRGVFDYDCKTGE